MDRTREFTEDELQPFAKPSCNKCPGTGRTGYINGIAQTCVCVKRSLHRLMIAGQKGKIAGEKFRKKELKKIDGQG